MLDGCDHGCDCAEGPKAWEPAPLVRRLPPPLCRICGIRLHGPCSTFMEMRPAKAPPVPPWPRLEPIELAPDAFKRHEIAEMPDRGRLPARPASLPGVRSSMGWTDL